MRLFEKDVDRKFHISYPSRNEFVRTLFDTTTVAAIKDMSDYTILSNCHPVHMEASSPVCSFNKNEYTMKPAEMQKITLDQR